MNIKKTGIQAAQIRHARTPVYELIDTCFIPS